MDEDDPDLGVAVECATFFVGDQPQAIWATDLDNKNLQYLRSIDPGYFEHVVKVNAQLLEGDDRHYAAAAIRVTFGQALETLMALIATDSLQAAGLGPERIRILEGAGHTFLSPGLSAPLLLIILARILGQHIGPNEEATKNTLALIRQEFMKAKTTNMK